MGSFRRGIRIFRSQEVIFESRPSFYEKRTLYKIMLLLMCVLYVLLVFPRFCYQTGEFSISPFWGHPGCEVPQL